MKANKPKLHRSDIKVNIPPRWGFSSFWVTGYKDVAPPELWNGGLVKTRTAALIQRQWGRGLRILTVLLFVSAKIFGAEPENLNPAISAWLSAQTNIHTWSAEFKQTRTLKALTQPLTASGRVWFAAPNRFRWELGDPPQTIAVRKPEEMLVVYPHLKRAERYPLTGSQSGPWRDALALLEAGFPRSKPELEARFRIMSHATSNEIVHVTLQPKAAGARRMMPQIKIAFGTNDFSLRATELHFADGSTLRNDFANPQLNPKLDEGLFAPKLEADYKVVEPLRR